jgi:hypothetical protein
VKQLVRLGFVVAVVVVVVAVYPRSVVGGQPPGKQVAGHVEAKAAALMRYAEDRYGVLVINNPAGPCPYASNIGCENAMRLILPKGSTIVVWWPGGHHREYGGTGQP